MSENKRPYTTGEIARMCSVTINAVKKWIAAEKLSAFRTPGGHFRIKASDFTEFLGKYKLDVKEALFPVRKRVLIIDDEKDVRAYIKGALETMDAKFMIETAADGYEALIKVGDFKPELLVLDIRMPRFDGFEVCRRIKGEAATKDIKILAVTAYGKEDMDKIIACGADYCLPKPIMLKEFQRNVQRLLG
ncbi:MAG: response regulator [Deltaproteobacteria bacterium]|nr:response regulator [Deltaproteobacteria bacterium]